MARNAGSAECVHLPVSVFAAGQHRIVARNATLNSKGNVMTRREQVIAELKKMGVKEFTRADVKIGAPMDVLNGVLKLLRLDGAIKITGGVRHRGGKTNLYEVVNLDAAPVKAAEREVVTFTFEAWRDVFPQLFMAPDLTGNAYINRIES